MTKSWKPAFADINAEIERIRISLTEMQFNPEFCAQIHTVKLRISELEERLRLSANIQKSEAAAMRAMIDEQMAEFRTDLRETGFRLKDLRILRHERAHANWVHIQELKKQADQQEENNKEGKGGAR